MQELKAKKLEMARLQIKLQQMENRKNMLLLAAEERARKQREAAEFEAMKLRVMQLEQMVAASTAAAAGAPGTQVLIPLNAHLSSHESVWHQRFKADLIQISFDLVPRDTILHCITRQPLPRQSERV